MTPFVEEVLDLGYNYGTGGGVSFVTDVVTFGQGRRLADVVQELPLGRWETAARLMTDDKHALLRAFFISRRGRAVGFRFRDWADYHVTDEPLPFVRGQVLRLQKTYNAAGADPLVKRILKPRPATVTIFVDGVASGVGVTQADGTVQFTTSTLGNITNVSGAGGGLDTNIQLDTAHGLSAGDPVTIQGLTDPDNSYLNGDHTVKAVASTFTFTIEPFSPFSNFTDTTGGEAIQSTEPAEGAVVTWSGEYDWPVHFDTDEWSSVFRAATSNGKPAGWQTASIPVQEYIPEGVQL